jgi:hypothetical protein
MSRVLNELDSFLKDVPAHVGAKPPSRLNYSHDAFIDLIVANPGISQNEIAMKLGYTASWVSTVMSTDTFKTALEKRRKELIDPTVLASIQNRFEGLARRSIEILEEKLSGPASGISENLAIRSLEVASRAAGFGARDQVVVQPAAEVHVHLDNMADNLVRLLHRRRELIEQPAGALPPSETDSIPLLEKDSV